MNSVMNEFQSLRDRAKSVLRSLFHAGDIDGDGDLTIDEFSAIIHIADANVSDAYVLPPAHLLSLVTVTGSDADAVAFP